jgi:hypothetical protein
MKRIIKSVQQERAYHWAEKLPSFWITSHRGILADFSVRELLWQNTTENNKAFCVLEFSKTAGV